MSSKKIDEGVLKDVTSPDGGWELMDNGNVTLHEAAEILGVKDNRIYQIVRAGNLTPKTQRPMTFDRTEVEELAKANADKEPDVPTMTLNEVAEMFGVTRGATYNWRKTGELMPLPNTGHSRQVLYSKADVERFAELHKNVRVGRPLTFKSATDQYLEFLERLARREETVGNTDTVKEIKKLVKAINKKYGSIEEGLTKKTTDDEE